jgi:hypothetical protein
MRVARKLEVFLHTYRGGSIGGERIRALHEGAFERLTASVPPRFRILDLSSICCRYHKLDLDWLLCVATVIQLGRGQGMR